jgi:hypothetical protein
VIANSHLPSFPDIYSARTLPSLTGFSTHDTPFSVIGQVGFGGPLLHEWKWRNCHLFHELGDFLQIMYIANEEPDEYRGIKLSGFTSP